MIGFYNYTIILTYMAVVSAVLGICSVLTGDVTTGVICLMFSGLCDMFDGPVARRRKRSDEEKRFGVQIDSLADVIAFGVLPAVIGYGIGLNTAPGIAALCVFVLAALTRLAYFNVAEEDRQQQTDEKRTEYEGLPVTTVALIIPVIYGFHELLGHKFPIVYGASLMCISLAFLIRIKIKKMSALGMLILIAVGIAELIWVLI